MIILHNPLDKASRDFVAAHGAGNEIMEYPDCVQRYPYISAFPSVVVAEFNDAHYVCRQPQNWADVESFIAGLQSEIGAKNKAIALAAIDANTRAAIVGGFMSSASGLPHRYDSDDNDQDNLKLMQAVAHSPRFAAHPIYQGKIPIRAVPEGEAEKVILYLDVDQMDLLLEDLALHIGACKQAGWAAQAEV